MTDYQDDEYQDDLGPSKSQLKREMLALQEVGRRMLGCPRQLRVDVPAVDDAQHAVNLEVIHKVAVRPVSFTA